MAITRDEALGGLVKTYRERRGLSQATVAELVSRETETVVNQNIISELERGRRWAKRPELPVAFARVLGIPRAEVQEAMGLGSDEMPSRPPTFAEVVETDDTLSRAAKDHLINQYGLLQLASQATVKQTKRTRHATG